MVKKVWLTYEDLEIPGLECGGPTQDKGYYDFSLTIRCRWGGMIVVPPQVAEHALPEWVGASMPTYGLPHLTVSPDEDGNRNVA